MVCTLDFKGLCFIANSRHTWATNDFFLNPQYVQEQFRCQFGQVFCNSVVFNCSFKTLWNFFLVCTPNCFTVASEKNNYMWLCWAFVIPAGSQNTWHAVNFVCQLLGPECAILRFCGTFWNFHNLTDHSPIKFCRALMLRCEVGGKENELKISMIKISHGLTWCANLAIV